MATYTSQPDEANGFDTWLYDDAPTTNYGTNANIHIGGHVVGDHRRGIIKFDLSSIPAGASLSAATLSIWFSTGGDYSNNVRNMHAYRMKRNWVEGEVTWNIYSTGNSWGTVGGAGANDIGVSHGSASVSATESANTELAISLTTAEVTKLIDGTYSNYGWLLKVETEVDDLYTYDSSTGGTAGYRPKLVIEYTTGPPGVKTINEIALSNIKTINGIARANVKTIQDLS